MKASLIAATIEHVEDFSPLDGKTRLRVRWDRSEMHKEDVLIDAVGRMSCPPPKGERVIFAGSLRENRDKKGKSGQPSPDDYTYWFSSFYFAPPTHPGKAADFLAGLLFTPLITSGALKSNLSMAKTMAINLINQAGRFNGLDGLYAALDLTPEKVTLSDTLTSAQRQMVLTAWDHYRAPHLISEHLKAFPLVKGKSLGTYQNAFEFIREYPNAPFRTLLDDPFSVYHAALAPLALMDEYWLTDLGGDALARQRIRAHVCKAITGECANGSTMADLQAVYLRAAGTLNTDSGVVEAGVSEDLNGDYFRTIETSQGMWVTTRRRADCAKGILTHLNRIASKAKRFPESALPALDPMLSNEQASAARTLLTQGAIALRGGPGTGKTTTLRAIIAAAKALGVHDPVLISPTGRACERMSQASGVQAQTIHRLLRYGAPNQPPRYNQNNPLPPGLYIIDEATLADDRLAFDLLSAIPDKAMLLIMGDPDQLPSVGGGAFFRDVVEGDSFPTCRFTQIHRQAATSPIIAAANAIMAGQLPDLESASPDSGFHWLPSIGESNLTGAIVRTATESLVAEGYAPDQIQVLSAVGWGDAGTDQLNRAIQAVRNPRQRGMRDKVRNIEFRPGDPVIQIATNHFAKIYNGETGTVIAFHDEPSGPSVEVAFSQDRRARYWMSTIRDLDLAYAISIHKSQGSEFAAVVVPVTMDQHRMLYRNLIFTAITRAKSKLVLIGEEDALRHAAAQADEYPMPFHRVTFLSALMEQERKTRALERTANSPHLSLAYERAS